MKRRARLSSGDLESDQRPHHPGHIGGSKPMTVEDYVAATRDEYNHDGRSALRDSLLGA